MASQREKAEALIEARDEIVRGVAVAVGMMLGGPAGARLGGTAGTAFNLSPVNRELLDTIDAAILSRFPEEDVGLGNRITEAEYLRSRRRSTSLREKKKRKPSAYNRRYSKCFKKLSKKYKKKSGGWKKDGFKRCAKAAARCAKK